MRRILLLLSTVLVVLVSAGLVADPAPAARPEKIRLEPSQFTIEGICGFPVELHDLVVRANIMLFFNRHGELSKIIIAGHYSTKLTNAETGTAITLNLSGQFIQRPNPDGSFTLFAHGRNLFFTLAPEPFMIFRGGRVVATLTFSEEAGLEIVINKVSGRGFDVCEVLDN
jgi:hypothetical protein